MQTSAFRVELIRFSLLVTLTVALLSVAIRISTHGDSHNSRAGATPRTPSSSSSPAAPRAGATSTPSPATTTPTRPGTSPASATPGSTAPGSSSSDGPTTRPAAQPVLPVTGDDVVKLVALSMVLIGAGGLTVRASRR